MPRFLLFSFFILWMMPFQVMGAENDQLAGNVKRLSGAVVAVQNAEVRVLKVGDDVYIGDILSTGKSGGLEITMVDQGIFTLGAETSFVVIDYTFGQGPTNAVVELLRGAMDGATGLAGKNAGLTVKTPVATIGIRGTKFFVGEEKDGYSIAHWAGGGVAVKNYGGEVLLQGANTGTFVSSEVVKPSDVKSWDGLKKEQAKSRVRF